MRNMLMVAAMAALMATTLTASAEPHPSQMYHIQRSLDPRFDAGKNTNEQLLANP